MIGLLALMSDWNVIDWSIQLATTCLDVSNSCKILATFASQRRKLGRLLV